MTAHVLGLVGSALAMCRSHKWLFIAILTTTLIYALFSLGSDYPAPYSARLTVFEHGWPLVYLIRLSEWVPGAWYHGFWRIYSGVHEVHSWPLLADIFVAVSLSFAVTWLWGIHCRRRKPWQIGVKEVLIVMAALAIIMGAYHKERRDYEHDLAVVRELSRHHWERRWSGDGLPWYLRPLNDFGVICESDWCYPGIEWSSDQIQQPADTEGGAGNINEVLAELALDASPLPFVHYVVVVDRTLNDQGVRSLCKLVPRCTNLYIGDCLPNITELAVACIGSHLRNLHTLRIHGAKLNDTAVEILGHMRNLEELTIDDRYKTTTRAALSCLLVLPNIRSLGVPEHWTASDEEQKEIEHRGISLEFIAPFESACKPRHVSESFSAGGT